MELKKTVDELSLPKTQCTLHDVAVQGNVAYVTDSNSLQLIDIRESAHPRPIGHYRLSGNTAHLCPWDCLAMDLVVRGDYAYVANMSKLQVVSIADLSCLGPVGFCPILRKR